MEEERGGRERGEEGDKGVGMWKERITCLNRTQCKEEGINGLTIVCVYEAQFQFITFVTSVDSK